MLYQKIEQLLKRLSRTSGLQKGWREYTSGSARYCRSGKVGVLKVILEKIVLEERQILSFISYILDMIGWVMDGWIEEFLVVFFSLSFITFVSYTLGIIGCVMDGQIGESLAVFSSLIQPYQTQFYFRI